MPDPTTMNDVVAILNTVCNKTNITYTTTAIAANGNVLTQNDVMSIEKQNRVNYTSGNTLSIYVLITDNNFLTKDVLGFAYRNTSICLFGKTIYDNSGGLGQPNRIIMEENVLEHELGHLMGLVNLGSSMQTNHVDAAHANHCNNKSCLMYYAAESTDLVSLLMTGGALSLDANCLADLHANGGK
ncbi:MAG: M12 family metallo-peptidase, partial [Flavipsychrobacter sp.]